VFESIRRILFVQQADLLEEQQPQVLQRLKEKLPDAEVFFAGTADQVPVGAKFDALIAPTVSWLPEVLERIQGVDWIHFLSAGVEKIWDMDFDKQSILMTKSSGVHGRPMSEFAIGAMLYFAKQFGRFSEQSRQHVWERGWLDELTGRRLAVLGLGHVGQAVAERAKMFGMRVVGTVNSPRTIAVADHVFPTEALREALQGADYLCICLPLTPSTRGLVDHAALSQLRRGAVVVDISRGGVMCQSAVLQALDAGHLSGAALDVFENEPLETTSPLWGRPDLLLTPHVSGTTPHYVDRALDVFLTNAERLLAGETPATPIDVVRGY
jgi:phosphoglycerate dehydrogenase-like enzyme